MGVVVIVVAIMIIAAVVVLVEELYLTTATRTEPFQLAVPLCDRYHDSNRI